MTDEATTRICDSVANRVAAAILDCATAARTKEAAEIIVLHAVQTAVAIAVGAIAGLRDIEEPDDSCVDLSSKVIPLVFGELGIDTDGRLQ